MNKNPRSTLKFFWKDFSLLVKLTYLSNMYCQFDKQFLNNKGKIFLELNLLMRWLGSLN